MDKLILSRAIALRPISNYPQHEGRRMMYKTQFNTLSYLWLWPMTWVYLHYTVAHSKSFTSVGDYWRERRKGSNCGCICGAGSNAHFSLFSLMRQTTGPVCLQLHGQAHSFRRNSIWFDQFPGLLFSALICTETKCYICGWVWNYVCHRSIFPKYII